MASDFTDEDRMRWLIGEKPTEGMYRMEAIWECPPYDLDAMRVKIDERMRRAKEAKDE